MPKKTFVSTKLFNFNPRGEEVVVTRQKQKLLIQILHVLPLHKWSDWKTSFFAANDVVEVAEADEDVEVAEADEDDPFLVFISPEKKMH